MNFRKSILSNKTIISGLSERGYFYLQEQQEDPNFCIFGKSNSTEIRTGLSFNIWNKDTFQTSLSISSRAVAKYYIDLKLFLEDPDSLFLEAETILSVNLDWLYWNIRPNELHHFDKYEYKTLNGIRDFFHDFDTVGAEFIARYSSPFTLAELLSDLTSYPCNIKLGGGLVSVDPYIYSALLFYHCDDHKKAKEVLEKGLNRYTYTGPGMEWQVYRFTQFQERRRRILAFFKG